MRVAVCARVSTLEQAQGHSLATQRDALTAWALREGWQVADFYEDAGITATDATKRLAFLRMVADAQEGHVDRVLVTRRDRYARDLVDAATYERLLANSGFRVWSLEEPATNDDSSSAFLMKGMLDVFSAHYSVELSRKVAAGYRTRALKGLTPGDTPFGYRSRGRDAPELAPEEAAAVKAAYNLYAAGNHSAVDVADELNRRGLQPRSKRGRTAFGQAAVLKLLSNRFYVGDITYHGEVVAEGLHEPIIERALFDQVQRVLAQRARRPRSYARHTRTYQLAGLGYCAGCSSPLWANTSGRTKKNRYYRCSSRRRGGACRDATTGALAHAVEEHIGSLCASIDLPSGWQARVLELAGEGGDQQRIAAERDRLRQRLSRVRHLLIEGYVPEEHAKREIRDAEAALAVLAPPDARILDHGQQLMTIPELWPRMTEEERRDVVKASMEFVSVDLRERKVQAFLPKPHLEPLFTLMPSVTVCNWRPRPESNRRPRP